MGIDALSKMVYEKYLEKYGVKEMEQVLVFPESVFNEIGFFRGVSREGTSFLENEKFISSLRFMPRDDMEKDSSWKQLIPYCVIKFQGVEDDVEKDENKKGLFFVYQRTKKGGEQRLHDKYSIGVGGHINPCDSDPSDGTLSCSYFKAMLRELEEEVSLKGAAIGSTLGMIYDDSNEVGKVHFGIVHVILLSQNSALIPNDPALDKGDFVTYNWLIANVDKFENWSQLVIKELL